MAVRPSPQGVGHELRPAADAEAFVECGHVLVRGREAQSEAVGDLFLAVAFEQTGERLAQPRRESSGLASAMLTSAAPRAGPARHGRSRAVAARAARVAIARSTVKAERAERLLRRLLVHGDESVLDLPDPEISVRDGRAVILRVLDELSPGAGEGLARDVLDPCVQRVGPWATVSHVGAHQRAIGRAQTGTNADRAVIGRSAVAPTPPRRPPGFRRAGSSPPASGGTNEPRRSRYSGIADQPIGVMHLAHAQHVRLPHDQLPSLESGGDLAPFSQTQQTATNSSTSPRQQRHDLLPHRQSARVNRVRFAGARRSARAGWHR